MPMSSIADILSTIPPIHVDMGGEDGDGQGGGQEGSLEQNMQGGGRDHGGVGAEGESQKQDATGGEKGKGGEGEQKSKDELVDIAEKMMGEQEEPGETTGAEPEEEELGEDDELVIGGEAYKLKDLVEKIQFVESARQVHEEYKQLKDAWEKLNTAYEQDPLSFHLTKIEELAAAGFIPPQFVQYLARAIEQARKDGVFNPQQYQLMIQQYRIQKEKQLLEDSRKQEEMRRKAQHDIQEAERLLGRRLTPEELRAAIRVIEEVQKQQGRLINLLEAISLLNLAGRYQAPPTAPTKKPVPAGRRAGGSNAPSGGDLSKMSTEEVASALFRQIRGE